MTLGPNDNADEDLSILVEVARRMGETFELDPLLETIEQAVRAALDCDRATIFLYDTARDELFSKVATGTSQIRFSAKRGIAGQAVQTRGVIHVPDAYADERFNPEIDKQTGYRTRNLLTLPLMVPGGEVIGVLQVLNKQSGPFTAHDEQLAAALGSLTGIAIKRQMLLDEAAVKRRLEHDLEIARSIQQRLLPKKDPVIPMFDIAGWNKPADQTGGDCYDFLPLGPERLAIMIADATGHGIGPALIVAQCRSLLRAVADTTDDLSAVIGKVNRLLCDDLPDDRFVTSFFGVLDAAARELRYVSAGHGPLLLVRGESGTAVRFDATGPPMGIFPDVPMELGEPIRFDPGDIFVLVTDGFIEWSRQDGEQYGEERLIELIRENRQRECAELIQLIYHNVLFFCEDTPQRDDLTAVLIKRTG